MLYGCRKGQCLVCDMAAGRDNVWYNIWRQEEAMFGMLYGDRKGQCLVCYMATGRDKVWYVIW